MRRRDFIAGLGAAAWPLTARAQQRQRMRRIGVHNAFAADDQEGQRRVAAFLQALQPLGWTVGRNVEMEHRWGSGDPAGMRKNAEELVALAPDVILTTGAAGVAPLVQATRSVPIVFVLVSTSAV
jgi:putative tryptophan/tyrosine transport system substrate-binding protein